MLSALTQTPFQNNLSQINLSQENLRQNTKNHTDAPSTKHPLKHQDDDRAESNNALVVKTILFREPQKINTNQPNDLTDKNREQPVRTASLTEKIQHISITLEIRQKTLTVEQSLTTQQARTSIDVFAINQAPPTPAVETKKQDPLILDLNGDGITTTGVDQGSLFDLDADGKLDHISHGQEDDQFLALDQNRNGIIDDGRELFGDQNGAMNGFEELRKYDDNRDGVINQNDSIFSALRLLKLQPNGQQQLQSLSEAGITELSLNAQHINQTRDNGDIATETSTFQRIDGSHSTMADFLLTLKSYGESFT